MTNSTSAKAGPRDLLFWPRAAMENIMDLLVHATRAVRCAREAERLFRLPNAKYHRIDLKRDDAIQSAFESIIRS